MTELNARFPSFQPPECRARRLAAISGRPLPQPASRDGPQLVIRFANPNHCPAPHCILQSLTSYHQVTWRYLFCIAVASVVPRWSIYEVLRCEAESLTQTEAAACTRGHSYTVSTEFVRSVHDDYAVYKTDLYNVTQERLSSAVSKGYQRRHISLSAGDSKTTVNQPAACTNMMEQDSLGGAASVSKMADVSTSDRDDWKCSWPTREGQRLV